MLERDAILTAIKSEVIGWIEEELRISPATGSNLIASGGTPAGSVVTALRLQRSANWTPGLPSEAIPWDTEIEDAWGGWDASDPAIIYVPVGLILVTLAFSATLASGPTPTDASFSLLAGDGVNPSPPVVNVYQESALDEAVIMPPIAYAFRALAPGAFVTTSLSLDGVMTAPTLTGGVPINISVVKLT